MTKKGRAKVFFITLIFYILGTLGMAEAYLSVLNTRVIRMIYAPGLIAVCILLALIYGRVMWKRSGILTGICAAVFIFGFWYCRELIAEGLAAGVQGVLEQMNKHFKMNLVWPANPEVTAGEITFSLFMVILPLAALLCWSFFRRKCLPAALLLLLPVFICLWTGGFCSISSMVMMLAGFLGLVSGGKEEEHAAAMGRMVLCMTVLCLFTAVAANYLVKPVLDKIFDSSKGMGRKLQVMLNEQVLPEIMTLASGGLGGGSANGELDRDGGFVYTGARMLEVTLEQKPVRDLYLKGFIGNTYTGVQWEADSDERIQAYYEGNGWDLPESYSELMNLSFYAADRYFDQNEVSGASKHPDHVEIRRIAASGQLALYPYGALLDSGGSRGDGTVERAAKREVYQFYPILDYCWGNTDGSLNLGEYQVQELQYRQYVYDNYRNVPEERVPRLAELCGRIDLDSSVMSMDFVRYILQSEAKYNINAPVCPEKEDFAENFLFRQKEGYCVHFATAAVLMLREMGIPARYVSGYLVPASSFALDADGSYRAVVEDRQAHAWAEVYLDGVGWYPLETTPGGVALQGTQRLSLDGDAGADGGLHSELPSHKKEGQSPSSPQDEDRGTEKLQEDTDSSQEASEDQEAGEDLGQGDENAPATGWKDWVTGGGWKKAAAITGITAAGALMLILLAVFCLWIRREVILGGRLKKRRQSSCNQRIAEAFRILYRAMVFAGLPQTIEPASPEFIQEAAVRFPGLPMEELESLMEDAVRSSFGDQELPACRADSAEQICGFICMQLGAGMTRWNRIVFRLWKVYY